MERRATFERMMKDLDALGKADDALVEHHEREAVVALERVLSK